MKERRLTTHNPVNFTSPTPSRKRRQNLRRPEGWNRKCQRCGGDPWPNYLLCPYCYQVRLLFTEGGYEPSYSRLSYKVSAGGSHYE